MLDQNREAMFGLNAYRAECFTRTVFGDPPTEDQAFQVATIIAMKPMSMRYNMWFARDLPKPGTASDVSEACDGSVKYVKSGKDVTRSRRPGVEEIQSGQGEPWGGFYSKKRSFAGFVDAARSPGETVSVSYAGEAEVNGVLCDKVLYSLDRQATKIERTIFIARADHLVRRLVLVYYSRKGGDLRRRFTSDAVIRNIELHPVIDPAIFNPRLDAAIGHGTKHSIVGTWRLTDGKGFNEVRIFHRDGSWESREHDARNAFYNRGTYFFDGDDHLALRVTRQVRYPAAGGVTRWAGKGPLDNWRVRVTGDRLDNFTGLDWEGNRASLAYERVTRLRPRT